MPPHEDFLPINWLVSRALSFLQHSKGEKQKWIEPQRWTENENKDER